VEWLGAELYVYFDTKCQEECPGTVWPEDLRGKAGENGTIPIVARLDHSISIRKGEKISLRLDTRKIQLFDWKTGRNYLCPNTAAMSFLSVP